MAPLPRVALALRWLAALTQGATAAQPPSPPSSTPEITAADRYAIANTLPPPPPTAPPSTLPFLPFAPSPAPGFVVVVYNHDNQLHRLGVVVIGVGIWVVVIAACAYWKRKQQAVLTSTASADERGTADQGGPQPNVQMAAAIEALPTRVVADSEVTAEAVECSICLGDLAAGESLTQLPCGHEFHGPCIRKWLWGALSATCPLCKAPVSTTPAPVSPPTTLVSPAPVSTTPVSLVRIVQIEPQIEPRTAPHTVPHTVPHTAPEMPGDSDGDATAAATAATIADAVAASSLAPQG